MQENNFDKDLQRELDAFRMQPSEDVWKRVEDEIRERKRRRIIGFFFLSAGIALIGAVTYYLIDQRSFSTPLADRTINNQDQSAVKKNNPPDNKQHDSLEFSEIDHSKEVAKQIDQLNKVPKGNEQLEGVGRQNDQLNEVVEGNDQLDDVNKRSEKSTSKNAKKTVSEGKRRENVASENLKKTSSTPDSNTFHSSITSSNIKKTAAANQFVKSSLETDSSKHPSPNDSLKISQPILTTNNLTGSHTDSITILAASNLVNKTLKGKRFRIGVEVIMGNSSLQQNGLFLKSRDLVDYNAPGSATGGVFIPPSNEEHGLGISLGVISKFAISKKSYLQAGLQYQQLSTRNSVGNSRDTSLRISNSYSQTITLDNYYSTGAAETFSNRFHFVQIPITYLYRLNKSSRNPITWNAGLGIAYLVKSKALLYDASRNFYYSDATAYKRFNFSLNTGFSFGHSYNSEREWNAGPLLQWNLTRYLKGDDLTPKHFVLLGLKANFFFTRKK